MEGKYSEKRPIRESFNHDLRDQGFYESESWFQWIPKRYIVSMMAFMGFCNIYALRVNLSVAMVAMVNNQTNIMANGTMMAIRDFNWDSRIQGLVLSSFFYGYIVTQLPGGWLATRFGGKYMFGGGVLGTALLTIVSPPASRVSVYFLVVLRVIEGLLEGVTYPCIHSIWSKWAPPMERSKLATFAFSGSYIGTVIALPLSSIIAKTIGWPWIFYIFGMMGVVWYIAWVLIVTESPATCSNISKQELEYIQQSIGFTEQQARSQSTPWAKVLASPSVWAIIVAHFVANWGFYTLLTELPTYLYDVTHFNLFKAGFVGALPYLVMAVVVMGAGFVADFIRVKGSLSTTNTRKLFTCGAFIFQLTFMLCTAYSASPVTAVACLTVAVGVGGFAWAGFGVNHLDIAPQFASVLMGLSNMIATIPGMISPSLTGYIVRDKAPEEWRIVFFITAGLYAFGALVYGLLACGERQPWAEMPNGYQPQLDDGGDNVSEISKDVE